MTQRNSQGGGLLDRIAHASPRETPDPRDILSSLGEVVYDWDLITDRMRWGPSACDVLGFSEAAGVVSGAAYAERIASESPMTPHEAVLRSRERDGGAGVRYQLQYGLIPAAGSSRRTWVEDVGRWFAGPDGRPARAHGVLRVSPSGSETTSDSAPPIHYDASTGTLSRAKFVELSGRMFAESSQNRAQSGLMLVALDGLAIVNQLYGYSVADQLIAGVGRRLKRLLRSGDMIGRYAGNKFAVALAGCDAAQLAAAARRCIEGAGETFPTDCGALRAVLRIGGVVAPRYGSSLHSVFLHAEEALDCARSPGSPRFVAYEPDVTRESARKQTRDIAAHIVSALNDKRIAIALEPVVDAGKRQVAFYEALMRLRLENGALISPTVIFSVAEKAGLAPLLDQRVLELALARLSEEPELSLSVNMSGLTSREPDWPERTRATFAAYPHCANRLIIEITETCAIEDLEGAGRTIKLLKDIGARVAMDDFGAGHTSFRNLRRLELDLVKIDGAFIQNLARSADDRFFVRTLIDLARHVGIPTVAEWVEDEESARLLRKWGVAYFQGALFGRASETEPKRAGKLNEAAA